MSLIDLPSVRRSRSLPSRFPSKGDGGRWWTESYEFLRNADNCRLWDKTQCTWCQCPQFTKFSSWIYFHFLGRYSAGWYRLRPIAAMFLKRYFKAASDGDNSYAFLKRSSCSFVPPMTAEQERKVGMTSWIMEYVVQKNTSERMLCRYWFSSEGRRKIHFASVIGKKGKISVVLHPQTPKKSSRERIEV